MKTLIRKILKESLLLESRVDTVFNKYIKKYESLLTRKFSHLEPLKISEWSEDSLWFLMTDLTNGHLDFNGRIPLNEKYLDWLVKTYLQQWENSGISPLEKHVELFIKTVHKFDTNSHKIGTDGFKEHLRTQQKHYSRQFDEKVLNNITDINVYPDFNTFRLIVDESENYITPSQKKKIARDETNRIYEDDRWLIIEPLSEKSSCMYGQGTKWCTAAKESNQFTTYHNDSGTLYYIINKDDDEKWALQVGFEMVINEDWEYCTYELYDDEDDLMYGGNYFGKGDLDEALIAWIPDFPMGPYNAIENHYNKRLKEIDGLEKIDYTEVKLSVAEWIHQKGIPMVDCFGIIDYENDRGYNELQTNLNHAFQDGELPNIPKLGEMFLNNDEGEYQLSLLEDED